MIGGWINHYLIVGSLSWLQILTLLMRMVVDLRLVRWSILMVIVLIWSRIVRVSMSLLCIVLVRIVCKHNATVVKLSLLDLVRASKRITLMLPWLRVIGRWRLCWCWVCRNVRLLVMLLCSMIRVLLRSWRLPQLRRIILMLVGRWWVWSLRFVLLMVSR